LVERVSRNLLDPAWWPDRIDEIAARQMSLPKAVELTADLDAFTAYAKANQLNGIVGDINNFLAVDAEQMFQRMLSVARDDVQRLLTGRTQQRVGEVRW
jgi:hypothetical protein